MARGDRTPDWHSAGERHRPMRGRVFPRHSKGKGRALSALVVFSDQADLPWLRFLRRGYRHCFLAFLQESNWVIYDSLVHRTEISTLDLPSDFDLAGWYRTHGFGVLATEIRPPSALRGKKAGWIYFPLRPFTCVEAVKRVLGIEAAHVFTPWQLYRHLRR